MLWFGCSVSVVVQSHCISICSKTCCCCGDARPFAELLGMMQHTYTQRIAKFNTKAKTWSGVQKTCRKKLHALATPKWLMATLHTQPPLTRSHSLTHQPTPSHALDTLTALAPSPPAQIKHLRSRCTTRLPSTSLSLSPLPPPPPAPSASSSSSSSDWLSTSAAGDTTASTSTQRKPEPRAVTATATTTMVS